MSFAPYWLGLSILLAFTLETITGFGSVVIALSLGALLLPIELLMPIIVPLSIGMSGYLLWRHRQHIDTHLLLGTLLPGMLIGTLIGYCLLTYVDTLQLKRGFGLLISLFAARELWRLRRPQNPSSRPAWLTSLLTVAAGISHGLLASGGPLLVFSLAGSALNKARLRATLVAVWFTLNALLTIAYALDGRLQPALPQILSYAPVVVLGIVLGEWLHRRAAEHSMRRAIYLILLTTGLLLVAPWSVV